LNCLRGEHATRRFTWFCGLTYVRSRARPGHRSVVRCLAQLPRSVLAACDLSCARAAAPVSYLSRKHHCVYPTVRFSKQRSRFWDDAIYTRVAVRRTRSFAPTQRCIPFGCVYHVAGATHATSICYQPRLRSFIHELCCAAAWLRHSAALAGTYRLSFAAGGDCDT